MRETKRWRKKYVNGFNRYWRGNRKNDCEGNTSLIADPCLARCVLDYVQEHSILHVQWRESLESQMHPKGEIISLSSKSHNERVPRSARLSRGLTIYHIWLFYPFNKFEKTRILLPLPLIWILRSRNSLPALQWKLSLLGAHLLYVIELLWFLILVILKRHLLISVLAFNLKLHPH